MTKVINWVFNNVLVIWAWTAVVLFAVAILSSHANALTLKKGEVLTANGVVHATESANTQAQVERNGFAIVAGLVVLEGGITVELTDLVGKSRDGIVEVIGEAAADAGEEIYAEVATQLGDEVSGELIDRIGEEAYEAIALEIEEAGVFDQLAADLESGYIDNYIDADGNCVGNNC